MLLLLGKQDATSGKWRKSKRRRPSIEVEEINAKAVEERRKETPSYEGFERARKPKKLVNAFLSAKANRYLICDLHKPRVRNISAPFQKPGKISSLPLFERSEKPAREQTFVCFD